MSKGRPFSPSIRGVAPANTNRFTPLLKVGVYGVIKETKTKACGCCDKCTCTNTTTETFGRLCLVSPALWPLGTTTQKVDTTYGRLAGVQDPATKAGYLYYRRYVRNHP